MRGCLALSLHARRVCAPRAAAAAAAAGCVSLHAPRRMTAPRAARRSAAAGASAAMDASGAGAGGGGANGADAAQPPPAASSPPPGAAGGRAPRKRPHRASSASPPPDARQLNIAVRPESYESELEAKVAGVRATFAAAAIPLPPRLDVRASARSHFRQRAEFGVWRTGDDTFYAMFVKGNKAPVRVESFPMGSERINDLMPRVLAAVRASPLALRDRLFQANFLTSHAGDALVTLIYKRALDDAWSVEAEALRVELGLQGLIGRSRGQKVVLGQSHVTERLTVGERTLEYKQVRARSDGRVFSFACHTNDN
jgi:tRNA (uracil-5-)-methyltransferase